MVRYQTYVHNCNLHIFSGDDVALARRGTKHTVVSLNASKACVTLVMCVSATGDVLPPLAVVKGKRFNDSWIPLQADPSGFELRFGFSLTGWMNSTLMNEWFVCIFLFFSGDFFFLIFLIFILANVQIFF
jgi:hypothetical protein